MSFLKLYVLEISEYYNNGLRIDNLDYWLLVKFNNWYIYNDWNINCLMWLYFDLYVIGVILGFWF